MAKTGTDDVESQEGTPLATLGAHRYTTCAPSVSADEHDEVGEGYPQAS